MVTGARQGLGRIFAEALASAGAEVFLMARSMEALEQAAAEIGEATGASCHSVFIDVLDEGSVASAAAQVRAGAGRLDILFNNAAVGRGSVPLQDTSLEEWNLTIGPT